MHKTPVLIIHNHPGDVISWIQKWGHRPIWAPLDQGLEMMTAHHPPIVLVSADTPEGQTLAADIRAAHADTQIMVLASPEHLMSVMANLKHAAEEFLPDPPTELVLEISLNRSLRTTLLLKELRSTCSRDRDVRTCDNVAREVENERFLAVRQIVEKMSAFIGKVAEGVQGGIRYFNELPYFVSVHSPDCRVLSANATYLKYLGNRLYRSSWGIYSGKRATRTACPVGRTVRSSEVMTTRALVRYKSGARVPVLVHTAPIYDDQGEVALVLEIFAGTQEIDQLAQQIRTTQQRYEVLFDSVPSYLAVLDRRCHLTAANRKFKDQFGDQVGRKFFDLFRPNQFPPHRDPVSMTMRDGKTHQGEMRLIGPDNRLYTMMAWTAPITTLSGKLVQILVIFTDVTELRQIKDNLASLGLLFSTVCHDIKGCLTGLDAGLYLIDMGFYRNQSGRIEEGLEVTRMMIDRIRKLVLDVLFSTKEREFETMTVDVLKFAGDVMSVVDNRIRSANISFQCDFSLCAGEFDVDVSLLQTALSNILENSLDACLEDPRPIPHSIEFKVVSREKEVIFEISDNGRGMDPEQVRAIFNIFYSSKGRKGTGLGLYITDKIVKKHQGTITVTSVVNERTRFVVKIPRNRSSFSLDFHRNSG
jgi:PAS domain S-box-containing protein